MSRTPSQLMQVKADRPLKFIDKFHLQRGRS
jgi:hypothetical protein